MPPTPREDADGLPLYLRWPAEALVAIYVILNAVARPLFRPLLRWLAQIRLTLLLEALFAHLHPYVILALLVVPFVSSEPAKLYAVYLMGTGHFMIGALVFVGAYFVSIVVVHQVYMAGKSKLRSLAWFARVTDWAFAQRDRIIDWMKSTRAWAVVKRLEARVLAMIRQLRSRASVSLSALRAWFNTVARKRRA